MSSNCHGWVGHLNPHARLVMHSPRVFAVYWGSFFKANPAVVNLMNQFFQSILNGPYMDGLLQYGIGKGIFVDSVVVEDVSPNPLDEDNIVIHLDLWLDNGTIPERPSFDTLYVIFTPPGIEVTQGNYSSNRDMGGYHHWGFYNNLGFGKATKFYAPIPWFRLPTSPTPCDFVNGSTFRVSHELVEAFSDRDGNGFLNNNGCEIGDICEDVTPVIVGRWSVSRYWSDSDQSCIPASNIVTLEDGSLIQNDITKHIDIIYGGAKFFIANDSTLFRTINANYNLGFLNGSEVIVSDAFYDSIPVIPKNGTLLREGYGNIYVIFDGAKFHIPDINTLNRFFANIPVGQLFWYLSPTISQSNPFIRVIPDIPKNGTLLREESGRIYVIYDGAKFHIPNMAEFNAMNFDGLNVRQLWNGALINIPIVPNEGTVLKERTSNLIYVITGGKKHKLSFSIVPERYGGQNAFIRVVPFGTLSSIPTGSPVTVKKPR